MLSRDSEIIRPDVAAMRGLKQDMPRSRRRAVTKALGPFRVRIARFHIFQCCHGCLHLLAIDAVQRGIDMILTVRIIIGSSDLEPRHRLACHLCKGLRRSRYSCLVRMRSDATRARRDRPEHLPQR
jgi:hypothetical protein